MAAVDIGSNSVRMMIGEVLSGTVRPLEFERVTTRLAKGLETTGELGAAEMGSTIEALEGFGAIMNKHMVRMVSVVGTSAIREARNSSDFINSVRSKTGFEVGVLSGEDEAVLTAGGVLSGLKPGPCYFIVDIGGGSTEFVLSIDGRVEGRASIPLGVVKLSERHILSDPPSEKDLMSIDSDCRGIAEFAHDMFAPRILPGVIFIGTAGTATTIASIDLGLERYSRSMVHMHEIPYERLAAMSGMLSSLPVAQRRLVKGLDPDRADLIIPGIRITIKIMEIMGFTAITISEQGLLEGTLLALAEEVSPST